MKLCASKISTFFLFGMRIKEVSVAVILNKDNPVPIAVLAKIYRSNR